MKISISVLLILFSASLYAEGPGFTTSLIGGTSLLIVNKDGSADRMNYTPYVGATVGFYVNSYERFNAMQFEIGYGTNGFIVTTAPASFKVYDSLYISPYAEWINGGFGVGLTYVF